MKPRQPPREHMDAAGAKSGPRFAGKDERNHRRMSLLADHSATVGSPAEALRCRNCGASLPARTRTRLLRVLRPARDRLRPRGDRPGHRARTSRPGRARSGGTRGCCRSGRTRPPGSPSTPAAPRWSGPTGWPPSWACGTLWVKDDSANPTHSFKDRVVSVALTAARQLGFTRVACASTGNLANSVAAHAARAGLDSVVLVPGRPGAGQDRADRGLRRHPGRRHGSYDDVNRLCAELAETDAFASTAFVNVNVRPYYAEGSKTLGYEVAEQLGWRLPRQVVIPVASGSLLTKVDKAFAELVRDRAGAGRGLGASSAPSRPAARRSRRRSRSAGTWWSRSGRPASPSR